MAIHALIQAFTLEDARRACDALFHDSDTEVVVFNNDLLDHYNAIADASQETVLLHYHDELQTPTSISIRCTHNYTVVYDGSISHRHMGTEVWFKRHIQMENELSFSEYMNSVVKTGYIKGYELGHNPMYGNRQFWAIHKENYRGVIRFPEATPMIDQKFYHVDQEQLQRDMSRYATLIAIHKRFGKGYNND